MVILQDQCSFDYHADILLYVNWIFSSILMFVSSAGLYLLVRKSSISNLSTQFNNLAMFVIPFIVFLSLSVVTRQSFYLSASHFVTIIVIAIIFSYLGNLSSLISMQNAPNPGYSLIISKSYVVFTSLVAVFIFDAQLTSIKILSILMILVFSSLILFSSKTTKTTNVRQWIPWSFVAFFCWGMLSISSKYLLNQDLSMLVILTYVHAIVAVCILFESRKQPLIFSQIISHWKIFIIIGLSSASFNAFQIMAINTAPNIGYVNAVNAASIAAVTVGAIILFKDELSMQKLTGVIGVTVGLLLLLLS